MRLGTLLGIIFSTIAFHSGLFCFSQIGVIKARSIGGTITNSISKTWRQQDGTYSAIKHISYGAPYLIKFDSEFNIFSEQQLAAEFSDILVLDDGSYLLVTTRSNENHGWTSDVCVLKYNQFNVLQWQRYYGGYSADQGVKLARMSDGSILVVGTVSSADGDIQGKNTNDIDIWLFTIANDGQLLDQLVLGGSLDEYDVSLEVYNGGLIAGISTASSGGQVVGNHGSYDMWVVNLDNALNFLWSTCIGGSGDDNVSSIRRTPEGEIYLGGYSNSTDFGFNTFGAYSDGVVVKLGSAGQQMWVRAIRGSWNDQVNSIALLSNGNIAAGGTSFPAGIENMIRPAFHGGLEGFIACFSPSAELIWSKSIGGNCNDEVTGVFEGDDGALVAVGIYFYCSNNGDFEGVPSEPGESRAFLMKLANTYSSIKGLVFYDNNNNGVWDIGEMLFNTENLRGEVETVKSNFSGWSSPVNGSYFMSLDTGTYATRFLLPLYIDSSVYGVVPKKKISYLPSRSSKDSFSFRILSKDLIKDLEVSAIQISAAFIGNSLKYRIYLKNLGGATINNAVIKLKIDDKIVFQSATKSPSFVSGDSVYWTFPSVTSYFTDSFDLVVRVKNALPAAPGTGFNIHFIAEPYAADMDSLDNTISVGTTIMGQNAAISNLSMDVKFSDSARVTRPIDYTLTYNFSSLLDSTLGAITLVKSAKSDFIRSYPAPSFVVNDTVTWLFKDLRYLNTDTIIYQLRVKDTPAVAIGDMLSQIIRLRLFTIDSTPLIINKGINQTIKGFYIHPDTTTTTLIPPNGIKWNRYFGGSRSEFANHVLALADSGFIVTGASASKDKDIVVPGDTLDAFVTRFDKDGHVIWTKVMGSFGEDIFYRTIATRDGNFIAVGSTTIPYGAPRGFIEAWVVKFKANGDTIWTKKYGSPHEELFKDVQELSNGDLIFAGETTGNGGDVSGFIPNPDWIEVNIWLVKSDSAGNILWQRCFNPPSMYTIVSDIKITLDNKTLVTGTVNPYQNGDFDRVEAYISKVDTNGSVLWTQKFAYHNYEHYTAGITINPDSSFVVGGSAGPYYPGEKDSAFAGIHGSLDWWLAKLDKKGNKIWDRYFGGQDVDIMNQIVRKSNGNFLLAGRTYSRDGNITRQRSLQYFYDAWLVEADSSGNLLWQKSIGGLDNDEFRAAAELADGSTIAVGSTKSNGTGDILSGQGGKDVLITKIGASNFIRGVVFIDKNLNGVFDTGEPLYKNGIVVAEKNQLINATTLTGGSYFLSTDTGRYLLRLQTADTTYFNVLPKVDTLVFNSFFMNAERNFRFVKKGDINDLRVNLLPLSIPRPGFEVNYVIKYENKGSSDIENVSVKVLIDQNIESATSIPAYSERRGDTLIWEVGRLDLFSSATINLKMRIKPPPFVQNGDSLRIWVYLLPIVSDSLPADNFSELSQLITGSYDPNDKSEVHGGIITPRMIEEDEYLTYLIRFQNTGNDTAFRVYIRDTLDDQLDWATFEMIAASHTYELSLNDGNKLEWDFKDILLPDSNTNEPGSHGFVAFRIKPKKTVQLLDAVRNRASIYFDFNLPVETNIVETFVDNEISTSCPGGNALAVARFPGVSYQWQMDSGTGYSDIVNSGNFLGATDDSLRIFAVSSSWTGRKFRCRITTQVGVIYGPEYILRVQVAWRGIVSKAWENPANWSCGVLPDEHTDVVIEGGLSNYPEIVSNVSCRSVLIKPTASITIRQGFNLTIKGR